MIFEYQRGAIDNNGYNPLSFSLRKGLKTDPFCNGNFTNAVFCINGALYNIYQVYPDNIQYGSWFQRNKKSERR